MPSDQISATISQNLATVRTEMESACERVKRVADSVQLVAVTKYAEWDWVLALAGLHPVFGENRPQQLAEREPQLPGAEWHLIGQLQRNKVRQAIQHAAVIHSVDSMKLLHRIALVATELKRQPRVLLQVNVSGEESKSGFSPESLQQNWVDVVAAHTAVEISGFMTMAPASDDPENARQTFRGLAQLRDELVRHPSSQEHGLSLKELSMGMSGDFQVAIEEGATTVRVGSRLYEGL